LIIEDDPELALILTKKDKVIIKILIIEDDPELALILTNYLTKYDMEVIGAEDPYIGLSLLTQHEFDLIILDLTLPGGMERGADDYMPKPYDPRELVTRIKTILRRTHSIEEKVEKKEELFVADPKSHSITFKGIFLDLTAAEYDILGMLIQHKNGSVSREQLLYESEHIDDDSSIKNIDVIISRIRQKIAKIDPDHVYIKPIRGVGYLLTDRV